MRYAITYGVFLAVDSDMLELIIGLRDSAYYRINIQENSREIKQLRTIISYLRNL